MRNVTNSVFSVKLVIIKAIIGFSLFGKLIYYQDIEFFVANSRIPVTYSSQIAGEKTPNENVNNEFFGDILYPILW